MKGLHVSVPYESNNPSEWTEGSSGVWSGLGEPRGAAALFELGFDWVCLDTQHGRFDDETLGLTLSLVDQSRARAVVRVRANDAGLIGRALDAGASGVIVPMVGSPADAADAVNSAFYPPLGQRSWGPMAGGYGSESAAPSPEAANARTLCAVMIETRSALEQVEQIAATPGVGMLFVGPFDLALALGTTVDGLLADAARTLSGGESAVLQRIVDAARSSGVTSGVFAGTPERARLFRDLGFGFIACATDALLLQSGASTALTR
jgi:4-hydroxy-2-oxoheptanedioate aldolase